MADKQPPDWYSTIGAAFLTKVAERLRDIKVEDLTAAEVARWTEVAMKLEQAGRTHRTRPERQLLRVPEAGGDPDG